MFESWTTGQKVMGAVVVAVAGYMLYEASKAPKLAAAPAPSGPVPSPGSPPGPPMPAPTPVAQPQPVSGTAQSYHVTTKASDLNVRSLPTSTNSAVIATIKQGSVVQAAGPVVLGPGSTTGWLPVIIVLPDSSTAKGYVSLDFLSPVTAVPQGQGGASVYQQTNAPQQPVGTFPLYRVTTGGAAAPVYDSASTASQNGTIDNGTLVYGTGAVANGFAQLLDPTSANLIAGWVLSTQLTAQPSAVNV